MKIIHKERIGIDDQTLLKGCIAINLESFIPPKKCISPCDINDLSIRTYAPFLHRSLYDMSGYCMIYKNKDILSELVYIHDAASLGFPSHQSLIDSKRLVNDSIDLSGLIIPEYYDVMENIPKDGHPCIGKDKCPCLGKDKHPCIGKDGHPCIGKDKYPHVPYINIEEIILELETLSLENKKKYISIALFSSLYNSIKSDIDLIKYINYNFSDIQFNIEKILGIAEEHNIIIHREDVINWVMDGIKYLGFKKYTRSDILALDRSHVTRMPIWVFRSIDPIPETIVFSIIYNRTHSVVGYIINYDDTLNHVRIFNNIKDIEKPSDGFYNDLYIPDMIHYLKTEYLKTE